MSDNNYYILITCNRYKKIYFHQNVLKELKEQLIVDNK